MSLTSVIKYYGGQSAYSVIMHTGKQDFVLHAFKSAVKLRNELS